MSLGIVIKGPEGIILAAESRVTLSANTPNGPLHVNYDFREDGSAIMAYVSFDVPATRKLFSQLRAVLEAWEAALPQEPIKRVADGD